jgi:hypothetical protein
MAAAMMKSDDHEAKASKGESPPAVVETGGKTADDNMNGSELRLWMRTRTQRQKGQEHNCR